MNKTERVIQDSSNPIDFGIRRLRKQKRLRDMVTKPQLQGISTSPAAQSYSSKSNMESCTPATTQLDALRKILGCDYSDLFLPC